MLPRHTSQYSRQLLKTALILQRSNIVLALHVVTATSWNWGDRRWSKNVRQNKSRKHVTPWQWWRASGLFELQQTTGYTQCIALSLLHIKSYEQQLNLTTCRCPITFYGLLNDAVGSTYYIYNVEWYDRHWTMDYKWDGRLKLMRYLSGWTKEHRAKPQDKRHLVWTQDLPYTKQETLTTRPRRAERFLKKKKS